MISLPGLDLLGASQDYPGKDKGTTMDESNIMQTTFDYCKQSVLKRLREGGVCASIIASGAESPSI